MNQNEIEFPPKLWELMLHEDLAEAQKGEIEFSDIKYNQEIIKEYTKVLNEFSILICEIDGKQNPSLVENEVKKLVLILNSLSKENGHFIGTIERDDLCLWIDDQIIRRGYELREEQDLTLDYREW